MTALVYRNRWWITPNRSLTTERQDNARRVYRGGADLSPPGPVLRVDAGSCRPKARISVWDDLFATDEDAYAEFHEVLQTEGIR